MLPQHLLKLMVIAWYKNALNIFDGLPVPDHVWRAEGFELCLKGVEAKFKQNKELWSMLKMTEPKTLVEASNDRLWGTGISLKDTHVLDSRRWHGKGWLSEMLHIVRENYQIT